MDVTGAGDLFAAGFLYGYTQGRDHADCGRIGFLAAGRGDQSFWRPAGNAAFRELLLQQVG